jgi:hypothetical protein
MVRQTKLAFMRADEVHDNYLRCAPSIYEVGKKAFAESGFRASVQATSYYTL